MDTQSRKRKIDCDSNTTGGKTHCNLYENSIHDNMDGWSALQAILEDDVLQDKVPTPDVAYAHLVRWFRIIVRDNEKLCTFRRWVIPSLGYVEQGFDKIVDCNSNKVSITQSPTTAASSSASLSNILASEHVNVDTNSNEENLDHERSVGESSTGKFTPDASLFAHFFKNSTNNTQTSGHEISLQQPVLLPQKRSPSPQDLAAPASTIDISPRMGGAGTLLTVTLKGKVGHARTPHCGCSLNFTANGSSASSQRIPGGADGELFFIVPHISLSSPSSSLNVRLTLCTSPRVPIVCAESFLYHCRDRALTACSTSDEDSEEMGEEPNSTGDEDTGSPPPQALPPLDISPNFVSPTPKQMMNIRERMTEHIQQGNRGSARVIVLQQPSVRVVWKNRRLDVPFKLRVENADDASNGSAFNTSTPSKCMVLAVVADHKGRLQIDAAENFAEDCSSQGLVNFSNLRMTKGTWGKEWTITFAAVIKTSLNNPVVVGVSTSCPIVVKTRKNPQVRHGSRVESPPKSPPQITFVERKGSEPRAKRHRVEDLLDCPPALPPTPPPAGRPTSHSEDMASLLAAAELKQQEQLHEGPDDMPSLPKNDTEHSFADFQNLMSYLDDVRQKRLVSLSILEQPQLKRDSKVLVVKKGKPFRVPFQVQLRSIALRHNPQNYTCVAVLRNDKGEEVAVRNNEVPFDCRGVACFAGLMVMKGTWGKAVQLTFEARWAQKRADKTTSSWTSHTSMLVVSETLPTQLMCYTKDKKSPGAP